MPCCKTIASLIYVFAPDPFQISWCVDEEILPEFYNYFWGVYASRILPLSQKRRQVWGLMFLLYFLLWVDQRNQTGEAPADRSTEANGTYRVLMTRIRIGLYLYLFPQHITTLALSWFMFQV